MATAPPTPYWTLGYPISGTQVSLVFASAGDGGSTVLEWQIGYGTDAWTPLYFQAADGTDVIGGLLPGTTYYFWVRGRNAIGWSGWSGRTAQTTMRTPPAPYPVFFQNVKQNSVLATFGGNGDGGSAITDWQFGYGKDPNTPQYFLSSFYNTFTGLDPGKTYYFWARGQNALGWGPWSTRSQIDLAATARVNVAGEWKRAIPYVKVNGVWKLAETRVKVAGVWKEVFT